MDFKIAHLTFEDTKLFPKVMMDYVKGESYLTPFYPYKLAIAEFKKVMEDRAQKSVDRKTLVKVLSERYKKNAPDATEFTLKNIKLLDDENCFTVTTGHQLCLFTGPLYFLYKIVSAIRLSQKLRDEYPDKHFVPVYWMASEDHDFAEINHIYAFDKKVEWSLDKSEIGGPVGSIPTKSLKPVLDNLFSLMGDGEHAVDLKKILQEAYTKYPNLAEATFYLVDKLFGKYGLVVIDPVNAELKKSFIPVIIDELLNQSSFKQVTETNARLEKAGVEPQIATREINLFYIDAKGRNRIEKQGDKYIIVGANESFTQDEIIVLAKKSPERFSPNVVLRPLYQQMILPNLAYVGGPSEVHYWLQLGEVFKYHKATFPILIPRNSATVVDKGTMNRMDKLKLTVKDMFRDAEELIKEHVVKEYSIGFEKEKEQLAKLYEGIAKKTDTIDPTLSVIPKAELQKQYNALKSIETKLIRAQKHKDETALNRIRNMKDKLFPDGVLQERHDNFIPFYIGYGSGFIDALNQYLDPLDFRMVVMTEE